MLLTLTLLMMTGADAQTNTADLTDAQVNERVQQYLGTIDRPISDAQWMVLGDRAVPILKMLSDDSTALPTRRAKAISALAVISPNEAAQHLVPLARDARNPAVVRQSAIRGLGRSTPPVSLVKVLSPSLDDPDRRIRTVAADVLTLKTPTEACPLIRDHAKVAGESKAFAAPLSRCPQK